MSEITRGVIGMPLEMAMESELSRRQFHSIAHDLLRDFDRVTAERDALQLRLNAADQRIDELERGVKAPLDPPQPFTEQFLEDHLGKMPDQLRDAAKMIDAEQNIAEPEAESQLPTYKPGLYAVRHIDNWDGQRDVVLTFAMLDAEGKWTEKETGEPLLTYTGDKVLRAWPLDCSDAPAAQIIGVPRNWLEDWALELVEAAQDGGQMSNQVEHLLEIHAKP